MDGYIGSMDEKLTSEHELQDATPIPLTAGYPENGTPAQQADWDRRYQAILDDGWMPGEPYVPALYGS